MADKLDRHALKGPDEFTVLVRRVVAWANANRRLLVVAGSVVGVVAFAAAVATWNAARSSRQAAEQFRRAHGAFQAERFTDAARSFEDLERDYPETAFGRFAILYRAHALRAAGQLEDAAAAYEKFLESGDVGPEYGQLALFALGQLREDAARTTDAIDLYEKAAALPGPYTLEAEVATARLQFGLGNRTDAQATYERILPDASGEMKALVEARLAALRSQR